jgi:hypothetical protein
VGHSDRDQLLGLGGQGAIGKDPLTEGSEGTVDLGRQLSSLLRELLGRVRVNLMIHGKRSFQMGPVRAPHDACASPVARPIEV